MLILAFDTTSEMGGVGIFGDGKALASVSNNGPANRYSITLFEMVQEALKKAGVRLDDIDLFAAANGPGSFTGIRVGLAAARAWGKAFGRPARGVSVLEALVKRAGPETEWAFPILDARRGEFFLSSFQQIAERPQGSAKVKYGPTDDGWVLKPDSLRAMIEKWCAGKATGTCVVRDHDHVAANLRATLPASLNWNSVEGSLVETIADLAVDQTLSREPASNAPLDAYYIRRPDAEINWKD
jgi:tRNA threonylcarbamoyladenosine biosynthesis protein TsaB